MKDIISKLLSIKSIVTLAMTAALLALLLSSYEPSKEVLSLFCTSYGSVMTYYFTRKDEK